MAESLKLQQALGNIAEGLRVSDDGGRTIDKASKWPMPQSCQQDTQNEKGAGVTED